LDIKLEILSRYLPHGRKHYAHNNTISPSAKQKNAISDTNYKLFLVIVRRC